MEMPVTSAAQRPKVLKGAIVGVDLGNPVASISIFQYNPESLKRGIAPQYSEAHSPGRGALRLGGPPKESISAELAVDFIDQIDNGNLTMAGIAGQLAALEAVVYPKAISVAVNQALLAAGTLEVVPPSAPLTLFVYGWNRVVPVKIESMTITETAHDSQLNPIRAEVSLSMSVLTYRDLPTSHLGYWTFMAHQVTKETLATVASVDNIGAALGEGADTLRF